MTEIRIRQLSPNLYQLRIKRGDDVYIHDKILIAEVLKIVSELEKEPCAP